MIVVTERAKQELKTILVKHVDLPQARLRIKVNSQGKLGLGIDIEMPGDKTIKYEGSTLLVVEEELAEKLNHITIDVEDMDTGSRLVIDEKSE